MKFESLFKRLLSEQVWEYDAQKVFYVINETGFKETLEKFIAAAPQPLSSGLKPAKKPMFQMGALAGSMADSQLWASALLEYFKDHGQPMKPKEILKNVQVKPNDTALFNFYKDVKEHLGEFVAFELPSKAFSFD